MINYRKFRGHGKNQLIQASRCCVCLKPIVFAVVQGEPMRLIPIDASSWDGSSFYISGKHRPHYGSCPAFLQNLAEYKVLVNADLVVEMPKGFK